MFHLKKGIFPPIIAFFIYLQMYPLNFKTQETFYHTNIDKKDFDNYIETPSHIYTTVTISHEDYDVKTETYFDRTTKEFYQSETFLYCNDIKENFHPINHVLENNSELSEDSLTKPLEYSYVSPWEHDTLHNHLKDNAIESRKQQIETNIIDIYPNNRDIAQYQEYLKNIDSIKITDDLIHALAQPDIKKYLKKFQCKLTNHYTNKDKNFLFKKHKFPTASAELDFLDALISGKIEILLKNISHANLIIAKTAFKEIKELWPWKRNHTFLTTGFVDGSGESDFIAHLGFDIMKIVEKDLISRSDYIAEHTNPESFSIIQDYKEKCIELQKKGNRSALLQEELRFRKQLFINRKNDNSTDNTCYAIAEKAYSSPITTVMYEISHAASLKEACNKLKQFELAILKEAEKNNLIFTKDIIKWLVEKHGFDILHASHNCYVSRPDYIDTFSNQSILSDKVGFVLNNIKYDTLPMAHEELINLQKQVLEGLESLNIIDPIEQKEFLVKDFGADILELANNLYKNRPDHQELVKSFIPIDVHYKSIDILNNSHDYVSIGQQFDIMAEHVFHNARLCKLDFVDALENHIIDSLHIIKDPQNDAEFVFNVTVVDHLLSDIQNKAESIVKGEPTTWQRSQELFLRGITKFVTACNPVNQVKSIYDVFASAGYHLNNAVWATAYELYDPITATQNNLLFYAQACESLVNSAQFTSDLTLGKLYLSSEEYQKRCDTFYDTFSTSPENIVDFVAQIAADFAFGKGLGIAFVYLKEIDALGKISNQATKVTNILKKAIDTYLVDHPILVTAEGVALQMSNDLKNIGGAAKEVIIDSSTLLENITKNIIETELFTNLKAIGDNIWQSPKGIIYGYDRKFGNTLNHILAHMTPNTIKKNHTVFSIPKNQLVGLIDEAWSIKGNPLVSDPYAYIVDMKRIIGTKGETAMRIIVTKPGTSEILTAYPITI